MELNKELNESFKAFFDKVKEDRKNVCMAVCVTEGEKHEEIRMAMHGDSDAVLAVICMAIHEYSKKTDESVTKVLLKIAGAMSEEE